MAENAGEHRGGEQEELDGETAVREQDRLLPIANVGRIMKQILPPNAKISKDAKETMQESVSEFVAFVTAEASDKCRRERRKTVNGDDVCWALASLGFDSYSLSLRRYLQRYRDLEGDRVASAQQDPDVLAGDGYDETPQPPRGGGGVLMGFGGVVERGGSSNSRQGF